MAIITVTGVDPGLVDTGVVTLVFDQDDESINVHHTVVKGIDPDAAVQWTVAFDSDFVFIEGYRPRSHFGTDQRMVEAVAEYRKALDATVILNTGVKKVVKRSLMKLLKVWTFGTPTHHGDLRSAAYILLYGMLKDPHLNHLLTTVVRSHLDGKPWAVSVH